MSETYNPHLKALLIGINYHNKPQLRLQGCANDAALAKDYLTSILRADPANITTLVDPPLSWEEGKVWSSYPTKENIVQAASRILANAEQGDVLLLHFSGHGTQIREQDGTIIGEALVPLDAEDMGTNFTNVLRDTELERLILEKTPPNVTLYIVLDCCYGGGDIEKLGTSLPYSRSALGTHVRAAIPRNLPSSLLQKRVETGGEGYKYPSMESRLRAVVSAKPNVVVFVGGSKFEPVVEATFNFMGYGVFSYSFYQTLKENKYLRNINIINSIQTNIRNAGFFQQPQLIAAREEICVWNFLSSVHGDENTNIISPSFANASRMMDARQIQEWQTIDSIATLEVNHELGMHRKRAGKWVPFVVEDIARIIAGVAGRTVLKIAQQAQQIQHQQEGLMRQDNNAAFALALTAIKDAIHRVLEILVPSPGAKRPPLAYPTTTMQDLVRGVVLPAVRGAIQASQLPASAKSIDVEAVLRDGFIVPNANAALSQHVGRAIYLADELRDIPVAAPDQLPETRELIDHALELAKQVIVTIAASEIYTTSLSGTPSAPDVAALANDIANRLGQAFNNDFVSRLISSPNPQRKIEKLCLDVLQGLVRDYKVALYSQDLADRVAELTTRFSGFVSLSTPVGHALLRARRKGTQTSAVSLAATLTESICACAVDDAVFERAHQQAGTPPSVLAPFPRIVPDLVKVAAHSVAELATHAVLDVLNARNAQNISTGALCGVLQSVAKTAATRVLDTLGTMRGEAGTWNWGSKGESSWNSYFYVTFPAAFASIAVDSALVGLRSLAVRYPGSLPKIVEDVEQLIKNYVNASLPRFLRFLPSLGLAIPLINAAEQALGSPQGRRTEEWAMANHGAEVLATSLASIAASRDASIDLPTATSIVKEAVAEFVLKMHENSIVANATESLQHALKKRNGQPQLKRITHSTLQDEVSRSALLFAPFSPASIPSAHTLFDVSAVFAGTASRAAQQCAQLPTGREGEVRVSPPFFVNFGRLIAQVAAGALLDVLQKQGVLTDQPKVRHLSKRIKNAATNIAVQLLSDTLAIRPTAPAPQVIGGAALPMPPPPTIAPTAPAYTTMLDQVVASMVPAVAKAARSIIGTEISTSEIALNTAAAQAVATRMRFMGNMLPILSTVSPPMLNNVTGLISTALAQRGKEEGTAYESDVERAGLTMMMALCENRDILQYKSGNVIDDVITQAVERAIQYARENRTGGSVEQAVKRAIDSFEFKGEGTRYLFEESLRPIATQVSQVAMRIPPTIAEKLPYASKTKGSDTLGLGQMPSTYLSSSDVERITQQVLSLYSFAPGFSDKSLRPIVAQTVSYVAHYNQLAHYPRNFVLELAKMAGCVAAREHLRPGANPKNTVTLGLAVVAQLLIPATSVIRAGPATE